MDTLKCMDSTRHVRKPRKNAVGRAFGQKRIFRRFLYTSRKYAVGRALLGQAWRTSVLTLPQKTTQKCSREGLPGKKVCFNYVCCFRCPGLPKACILCMFGGAACTLEGHFACISTWFPWFNDFRENRESMQKCMVGGPKVCHRKAENVINTRFLQNSSQKTDLTHLPPKRALLTP